MRSFLYIYVLIFFAQWLNVELEGTRIENFTMVYSIKELWKVDFIVNVLT